MTKKKLGLLAGFALTAAACADPASAPLQPLSNNGASRVVSSTTTTNPDVPFGQVRLCKISNEAGSFSFTVTGPAGVVASPSINHTGDGTEQCYAGGPIYTSTLPNVTQPNDVPQSETVTIVEDANAVPLTNIDVIRYLHPDPTYHAVVHLGDTEDEATRTAVVKINSDMSRKVTFTNTAAPPPGLFGCTPGYWKQPHHFGNWVGYVGGQSYYTVFGVVAEGGLPANLTLLEALQMGGGGIKAMVRHSVASLLNAAQGFAPYTTADIIGFVQTAFATNNYSTAHNLFEDYNETGCPLGRAPLTKN